MVLDLISPSGNRPRHSTNARIPKHRPVYTNDLNVRICDMRPVCWDSYAMALEAPYLHRNVSARTFVCKVVCLLVCWLVCLSI